MAHGIGATARGRWPGRRAVVSAGLAVALLGASATAALAQGAAAGAAATEARCRDLLAALPVLEPSGPGPVRVEALAGEDACRYSGLRFSVGGGGAARAAGWEAASLLVRGVSGLPVSAAALRDWPSGAVALRVEARGVAFSLRSGSAAFDWVNRQQQVPFDVTLDAAYDPTARRAVLRELSMDGAGLGRVSVEGVVEGLDPPGAAVEPARRATVIGVRSARVRLDSRWFVAGYLLNPLASVLPEDDPGRAVEGWKAAAAALARGLLPATGASPATVEAVAGFAGDFPRPRHPFALSVEAVGAPVGWFEAERAAASRDALARLLAGVRVVATYEGAFREGMR